MEAITVDYEIPKADKQYIGEFMTYGYDICPKCCGNTNGITASGTVATEGRTVASTLPFGTKLYIDGIGERVVEDRGGAIQGNKLDLFMSDHETALKFGVRKLDVYEVMED